MLASTPVEAESHSSSDLLAVLLYGPARKGTVVSRHDVRFGDYVVTLTAPRTPRMPNGIECRVSLARSAQVSIGLGKLSIGRVNVEPGPDWNPVPVAHHIESLPAGPQPLTIALGGWLAARDSAANAMLAGYVAGLVLLHGQRRRAEQIAVGAIQKAALSATLVRHAARGEVPEPIHDLLATGDAGTLIAFSPEGILWLRGLVSAGFPLEANGQPVRPPAAARRVIA
jgi:hypothetical protein